MVARSGRSSAPALAFVGLLLCASSYAQTPLLDVVHTVASSDRPVPAEHTFNAPASNDTYTVKLTDLGAQLSPAAPLAAVALAVTDSTGALVGTPLTAAGTVTFTGTAGKYAVHVVGTLGTVNSGAIGILVTDTTTGSQVASFSDNLALPATGVPNNTGLLVHTLTVGTSGSYQITLSDLQFPQPLSQLTLAITQEGGSLLTTIGNGTTAVGGTATVTLQSGVNYDIFAVGQLSSGAGGGLYGVNVSPAGGGAPVYAESIPLGAVAALGSATLDSAGYSISLVDLIFPNALSTLEAAVTFNGQSTAQLTASGNAPFTATQGTYELFGVAVPLAPATSGSYTVSLQPSGGGSPVFSVARAVTATGSAVSAYSFDTNIPGGGGTYALNLTDFALPATFSSLTAAAVQGGSRLGVLQAAGTTNVNTAAGPISLIVFAQPGTGGSLFGIDLTASGSSAVFATTQGTGQLFSGTPLNITSAGNYTVTLSDVGWPASLATLGVVVTQGATSAGQISKGGSFQFTAAGPGTYFVNFMAQPQTSGSGSSYHAGTYALTVAATPVAPTVTLTSSATSVVSGGTVNLTWTTQNATSCSATSTPAGAWSGTQTLNGSATSGALTSSTTFTLACTGPGGNATGTASVSVTGTPSKGGGGGGTISDDTVGVLLVLALWRLAASRRRHSTVGTGDAGLS